MAEAAPPRVAALIVAAGRGTRLGTERPKQYLNLCGVPVLQLTVAALLAAPEVGTAQVVIGAADTALYNNAMAKLTDDRLRPPVMGGASRAESVACGLEALKAAEPDFVLIHDAARPFVSPSMITAVVAALEEAEGAFLALPVVDALWHAADGVAQDSVPRDGLWRAQTPQGFHFDAICRAHEAARPGALDDVAVARASGLRVRVVPGAEENFKITHPQDMARAKALMAAQEDPRDP